MKHFQQMKNKKRKRHQTVDLLFKSKNKKQEVVTEQYRSDRGWNVLYFCKNGGIWVQEQVWGRAKLWWVLQNTWVLGREMLSSALSILLLPKVIELQNWAQPLIIILNSNGFSSLFGWDIFYSPHGLANKDVMLWIPGLN